MDRLSCAIRSRRPGDIFEYLYVNAADGIIQNRNRRKVNRTISLNRHFVCLGIAQDVPIEEKTAITGLETGGEGFADAVILITASFAVAK